MKMTLPPLTTSLLSGAIAVWLLLTFALLFAKWPTGYAPTSSTIPTQFRILMLRNHQLWIWAYEAPDVRWCKLLVSLPWCRPKPQKGPPPPLTPQPPKRIPASSPSSNRLA